MFSFISYILLPGRPVRAGTADVGERRVDHPRPEPRLRLELQTNLREDQSFTITEKAPTSAFTFKTLSRQYAKQAFTHGK